MTELSSELLSGSIVTTRIRLARNLAEAPFKITDERAARGVIKAVERALAGVEDLKLLYVKNLSSIALEAMKERHAISLNLMDNAESGAVLINEDESVSVMVNEEDVIREQCIMKGLRLTEAYRRLESVDDVLSKNLDIAYDDKFGYLTACPTNLGTGMRASVMMFLPALTESGKIKKVKAEIESRGLTMRGLYGEGSRAEGYNYQISNERTLGVSEEEILREVEETVLEICKAERSEMEQLYGKRELIAMDKAKKAFGVLTNAVLLSYDEFLSYAADVKLGAMLGVIGISDVEAIDDLIVSVRPANLCEQHGKKLSATDRDLFRAEITAKTLLKLID